MFLLGVILECTIACVGLLALAIVGAMDEN
jgi:hypothetical protein